MENSAIYSESIPIEKVLYGQFIKYTSLEKMVSKEFAGSNADFINIYIDLFQFYLPAFRFLKVEDKYSMTSITLNYCAHLRSFFRNKYSVDCNIFIVFAVGNENTKSLSGWESKHFGRVVSNQKIYDVMIKNLKMLRLLVQYIDGVYYMEDWNYESGVVIGRLIEKMEYDAPNIIISSSDFCFQLPVFEKNTVVFRKRSARENAEFIDTSYSYGFSDAVIAYANNSAKSYFDMSDLPPYGISLFMILARVPGKSKLGMFTTKIAGDVVRYIYNFNKELLVIGEPKSLRKWVNKALRVDNKYRAPNEEFMQNYMAMDYRYNMAVYIAKVPQLRGVFTKLNDPDALKDINNRYFIKYPIDLQRL